MPGHPRLPAPPSPSSAVDAAVALRHELADMSSRARLGGFFYVAGLVTVSFASETPSRHPVLFAVAALVFVLLGLLRLRRPPASLNATQARRWISRLWVIVWLSTGIWGLGAAWVVATTEIETARVLALVLIGAFGTTLSHVYAMRIPHAAIGLVLLFVPQLLVLLPRAGSRLLGVSLLIYFVYLLLVLRRSRGEYWQRVALEEETRTQRDYYEQQSRRDGLTGLPNRRRFDAMLAAALVRRGAVAGGDDVALILFDLDHFKAINDRFGHVVGDRCLVHFALCLTDRFHGAMALPARLGGEEFGVVLLSCNLAEARLRAEEVRSSLADAELLHEGTRVPFAVSGGVVVATAKESPDSLMARADAALYEAKRSGRDRIVATQSALSSSADRDAVDPAVVCAGIGPPQLRGELRMTGCQRLSVRRRKRRQGACSDDNGMSHRMPVRPHVLPSGAMA